MNFETIRFTSDAGVSRIQLDRPKRRNALNMAMIRELAACVKSIASDPEANVVLLAGDDVAFCAGQDLKEPEAPEFIPELNALLLQIEACPKPVIAVIGGWCLAGGLELALACDLRVASEDAKIGDYHSRINSLGGAGALARLPRLIGVAATKALYFTGDVLSGRQAHAIGLVNEVHAAHEHAAAVMELACRIAEKNPVLLAKAKETLRFSMELPLQAAIDLSIVNQRRLIEDLGVDFVASYSGKSS